MLFHRKALKYKTQIFWVTFKCKCIGYTFASIMLSTQSMQTGLDHNFTCETMLG